MQGQAHLCTIYCNASTRRTGNSIRAQYGVARQASSCGTSFVPRAGWRSLTSLSKPLESSQLPYAVATICSHHCVEMHRYYGRDSGPSELRSDASSFPIWPGLAHRTGGVSLVTYERSELQRRCKLPRLPYVSISGTR